MIKEKISGCGLLLFAIIILTGRFSFPQVSAPHNLSSSVKDDSIIVSWVEPASRNAVFYNVYRVVTLDTSKNVDLANLHFTKINSTTSPIYKDSNISSSNSNAGQAQVAVYYYITAVDKDGHESYPSQTLKIIFAPKNNLIR